MAGRYPPAHMDVLVATRKNESPYEADNRSEGLSDFLNLKAMSNFYAALL